MKEDRFISLNIARHKVTLWIVAFIITVSSAVYQRMTGPTYPVHGSVEIGQQEYSYKFLRSYSVGEDVPVSIEIPDTAVNGYVEYRRYRSHDKWMRLPLQREGDALIVYLPQQPAAGKLMYRVYLQRGNESISLNEEPVVLRYKGAVPAAVLIPHVILMFLAMLFSNRTALEALDARGNAKRYMLWTIGFFLIGGFILGPLVQKYAFDALWTGVPFGFDLTDNKTLLAMLGWLYAWYRNRRGHVSRGSMIFASVVMLAVYLIPHSVLGSEIDYTQQPSAGN